MMLERQAEGIRIAKAQGKFKGRKPTARAKSDEVLLLLADGLTKMAVAEKVGIGVASVYRIAKAAKETAEQVRLAATELIITDEKLL
ncbi:MAG: helix-turn-helix domain-containing protein [Geobacteraceae bacterium]|nr:helix-turn-helix domain-containing protein [Geobacteraceae bacterium]